MLKFCLFLLKDLKYLSEPYSEDIDRDAARRLLDFGDDYRKYIDSDGSSFIGIPSRQRSGISKPRLQSNSTTDLDSEADVESLHQVIAESEAQLAMNQNILEKYANGTPLGIDLVSCFYYQDFLNYVGEKKPV